ncbi:MAG TPA: hypothetical protein VF584_07825 [Longimicrobium sp.]|jgi:hypothetical protein
MRFFAGFALIVLLAACGGVEFDPGQYDVTGRWTGTTLADTSRYDFDLDLTQNEEEISGSGTVRVRGQTVQVRVDGIFGFPNVDLTLSAPGFVPLTFDAAFRRDTIAPPSGTTPAVLRENRHAIAGSLTTSALEGVPLLIQRDTL